MSEIDEKNNDILLELTLYLKINPNISFMKALVNLNIVTSCYDFWLNDIDLSNDEVLYNIQKSKRD